MRFRYWFVLSLVAGQAWPQPVPAQTPPNPTTPPPGEPAQNVPTDRNGRTQGTPSPSIPPEQSLDFPERTDIPEFDRPTTAQEPSQVLLSAEGVVRESFPHLSDQVDVEVSPEGAVEVSGRVTKLSEKLELGEKLDELEETSIIINRVRIEPPLRSDREITRDVRRRLRSDEFLRQYTIDVETREQKVFLSGKVPSYIAVEEALRQAAEVRGVRDVNTARLQTSIP